MSELSTYIKLNRNIRDWRWYRDVNTKSVFIDLLLNANIEPYDFEKITIQRGEIATSYETIANNNGLTYKQARRAVQNLKSTKEIEVKRYSKFIVIKILNYKKYQDKATGNKGNQRAITGQSQGNQRATIEEYKESEELKESKKKVTPSTDLPSDGAVVEGEDLVPGTPAWERWRNQ